MSKKQTAENPAATAADIEQSIVFAPGGGAMDGARRMPRDARAVFGFQAFVHPVESRLQAFFPFNDLVMAHAAPLVGIAAKKPAEIN